MAADGVRELTLLGQNVNSYGRDLRPVRGSFAELLAAIDAIEGIERIRYTSPHPKDMREDVIRAHAELRTCASTSTCRCSRAPRGSCARCGGPTTASATWTASR
jgi:tRNA A37 methylthiotransferase MiaB